jgi:hypothetical protein
MKCLWLILLPALCSAAPAPDPELTRFEPFVWKSEPPGGCPFPPSATITGIKFLGRAARYTRADTWYPSWASDGNLYSNFTDGTVNGIRVSSVAWTRPEGARLAVTGNATILGDDPMNLKVTDVGVFHGDPTPYGGRYPSANLWHNGIWYYGTYTLADADGNPSKGLNWDILGPFVGFRFSRDNGRTWMDTPHTPRNPIFLEPARPWGAVRFGAPHFVDFGRNMEHSPDRKAYLVGHGARDGDPNWRPANASWVTGDEVYIARVTPTPETINDLSAWEFFAGHDTQGRAVWSRDFRRVRPIMEWNNNAGNVSITYNPVLKKYLMLVTDGTNTIGKFHTYLLESNHIAGPWRLSVYMKNFGQQAYFVNIPSKFLAADGRTAWLCYAANFSNGNKDWPHHDAVPPGGGYGMTLQEIRLLKPGEK